MYTSIHVHTYTYRHTHVVMYKLTHVHTYTRTWTTTRVHTTYSRIHIQMHTCISRTLVHSHTNTRRRIHTYTLRPTPYTLHVYTEHKFTAHYCAHPTLYIVRRTLFTYTDTVTPTCIPYIYAQGVMIIARRTMCDTFDVPYVRCVCMHSQ